jgi:hypothetical protein
MRSSSASASNAMLDLPDLWQSLALRSGGVLLLGMLRVLAGPQQLARIENERS